MKVKRVIVIKYPLEKKMKEQGYSCRTLAKKVGLHYTYINRLLLEHSHASEITFKKIIKILGE